VDGALIEAWASQESFQKKDCGKGDGSEFRGDKRTNDTHAIENPIPMPNSTGKGMARKPAWVIWDT